MATYFGDDGTIIPLSQKPKVPPCPYCKQPGKSAEVPGQPKDIVTVYACTNDKCTGPRERYYWAVDPSTP